MAEHMNNEDWDNVFKRVYPRVNNDIEDDILTEYYQEETPEKDYELFNDRSVYRRLIMRNKLIEAWKGVYNIFNDDNLTKLLLDYRFTTETSFEDFIEMRGEDSNDEAWKFFSQFHPKVPKSDIFITIKQIKNKNLRSRLILRFNYKMREEILCCNSFIKMANEL